MNQFLLWTGLFAGLILLTWLDYRFEKGKILTTRLLTLRVLFWISLALGFNLFVYFDLGSQKALEFFTGYLVEYSLSVDNLFVFIMLFKFFGADPRQELKALQRGIYGAMAMRLIFIVFGVTLIHHFHPIIYFFGALLLFTAYKMFRSHAESKDPAKNLFVRILHRLLPVTKEYYGDRFFVRLEGKLWATPMVALVLAVESSDVMFAIDSIPAILAITTDSFIVFSSNIFAILGLRALFFLLAKLMKLFRHLKFGVALILAFVGMKMLLSDLFPIPVAVSLGVIVGLLAGSIATSLTVKDKGE